MRLWFIIILAQITTRPGNANGDKGVIACAQLRTRTVIVTLAIAESIACPGKAQGGYQNDVWGDGRGRGGGFGDLVGAVLHRGVRVPGFEYQWGLWLGDTGQGNGQLVILQCPFSEQGL